MARRHLVSLGVGALVLAGPVAGAQISASAKPKPTPAQPDKVVIIVVDALSTEIVEKYDMQHVKALMADGVDTPRGYLGRTGSTLPDDTTYSVLRDHGGIQRSSQQIPIVFAGANLSGKDLRAEVTSVDIMPPVLEAMGIAPTYAMDGTAYSLPRTRR
jgi:hypothetical protein